MLAEAKKSEDEDGEPVGIFSHHPFPKEGLPEDTTETLVVQVQRILSKMKLVDHPAWEKMPEEMLELEEGMKQNRETIWAGRKLRPEHSATNPTTFSANLRGKLQKVYVPVEDEFRKDLWPTLHLVWGRLEEHVVMRNLSQLKDPHRSLPVKVWEGLEEEVGLFPARLQELLDALGSSTELPSFKELLSVVCGGSLEQSCTFCGTTMIVEAVEREVEGCLFGAPTVCLRPFLPVFFSCGALSCEEGILEKMNAWVDWGNAVSKTRNKLHLNQCDHCFRLADNVHR